MKNLLVLRSLGVVGLTLTCLIFFNLISLEQTPLELFFEDPISQFNTLHDDAQFYIALYYLNKILKQYPNQKEEILSSKALSFLKSNPFVLITNEKVLSIINSHAKNSHLKNKNLNIYELVFNKIRNKQITQQLPQPDLFVID